MERIYQFDVPVEADSIDSPIVQYGGDASAIHFTTTDHQWGRVTFERLDSIKVSRGEHEPFPRASGEPYNWVSTISESEWLKSRHEYESEHYGRSCNFGGNVDEMLTEYCHYLLSFHDEFVEAIAAGIWIDTDSVMLTSKPTSGHPLNGIAHIDEFEQIEAHGIVCQVRRNPLPTEQIERNARLCSQTLLEVGANLDGSVNTNWRLTHREINGTSRTFLRNYFGNSVQTYNQIPTLDEIRPLIDQWLFEVRERKRKMGKSS